MVGGLKLCILSGLCFHRKLTVVGMYTETKLHFNIVDSKVHDVRCAECDAIFCEGGKVSM